MSTCQQCYQVLLIVNWINTHNYIPFLGVLWGEVRGEESREEAFDWLSSGGFRCLSLPFSDRDKILWRDWGDWAPTDTKTPSQCKQDWQVTSRGRSNNTRTQLIRIGTTEKGLTKWWQIFVKWFLDTMTSICLLRSGASLTDRRCIQSPPLTWVLQCWNHVYTQTSLAGPLHKNEMYKCFNSFYQTEQS